MPARHYVLAIIVFWMASTAWLFYRDLRPRLLPGEPPPYTIDLADEAEISTIRWSVFKDNQTKPTGYAKTRVRYSEVDDTFEISGEFKLWSTGIMQGNADQVVEGKYRVTRDGQLRGIDARVTVVKTIEARSLLEIEATGRIEGDVKNRIFTPHLTIDVPSALHLSKDLAPVRVSERGNVLNPLQPVNRITGLKKGQRWRMPLVHPLTDAVSAAVSSIFKYEITEISTLEAEVLPETQLLKWGHALVPCLVVEYTGDDIHVRTWVREADGTVLRQEVEQHGESLVVQRDY